MRKFFFGDTLYVYEPWCKTSAQYTGSKVFHVRMNSKSSDLFDKVVNLQKENEQLRIEIEKLKKEKEQFYIDSLFGKHFSLDRIDQKILLTRTNKYEGIT